MSRNLERNPGLGTDILKREISFVLKDAIRQMKRAVRQLHGVAENVGVGGKQILVPMVGEVKHSDSPPS
jgi:hypothetical protein